MLARTFSFAAMGPQARLVTIEVTVYESPRSDAQSGPESFEEADPSPTTTIIGLADAAVRESRERVRSALVLAKFGYPKGHTVISLAPADLKKHGPAFDLPIALCLARLGRPLDSQAQIKDSRVMASIGELALDGSLRPVRNVLTCAISARQQGFTHLIVPAENAQEAAILKGIEILPARSFMEAWRFMQDPQIMEGIRPDPALFAAKEEFPGLDFSEVRGQQAARRAAEIAAAGGHNLLFKGPPGSGKTMLARRIPTILPPMNEEEIIETTQMHSAKGLLKPQASLVCQRPFRAPHHTVSQAGLIGGGLNVEPGEVSLAHNGVLFLDELPEFSRNALEALRQPLEDGFVHITRVAGSLVFPSKFMLVAAMNPCPCGNYGHPTLPCRCGSQVVRQYQSRISGPLLDRIDMHVEMPFVPYEELSPSSAVPESSRSIRERCIKAREIQWERYKKSGLHCNAQIGSALTRQHCPLTEEAEKVLKSAMKSLDMSARTHTRILRLARTIADLALREKIESQDILEALQFREFGGLKG